MFEKDLMIGVLLGHYGKLLSDRKLEVCEMYFYEDFSLSEIAEQLGISRQGVRELIVKAREELLHYEECLGLVRFREDASQRLNRLDAMLRMDHHSEALIKEFEELCEFIKA